MHLFFLPSFLLNAARPAVENQINWVRFAPTKLLPAFLLSFSSFSSSAEQMAERTAFKRLSGGDRLEQETELRVACPSLFPLSSWLKTEIWRHFVNARTAGVSIIGLVRFQRRTAGGRPE